jgi:ribonuclease D
VIADSQQIERIAADARAAGRLALDTEFMGEGRYRTLLCLIQVSVPVQALDGASAQASPDPLSAGHGERIDLIDPLSGELDTSPLADVLADPQIQIVVHAGRQDVALLRRTLSTEIVNVFDTQLAAGFAGLAAQRSYESLLSQVLGVRLAKSASFTRWDRRPLTDEQISYAREDVLHLLQLAGALQQRLTELGRLQWALQECEPLALASDARDLDVVFARLPRISSAAPGAQAIARELVGWRERTAERQDRPVQGVLADAALVEVAKRKPSSASELASIRGIPQGIARRAGAEIIECVRRGQQRPTERRQPAPRSQPPDPTDAPLVALAEALARTRAAEAGFAYELIATRADLQAIVAARRLREPEPEVRALSGWRRELLGQEILRLLDGEITLAVKDGKLRVEG